MTIHDWLHQEMNFEDLSSQTRLIALNDGVERYKQSGKPVDNSWLQEIREIEDAIMDLPQL